MNGDPLSMPESQEQIGIFGFGFGEYSGKKDNFTSVLSFILLKLLLCCSLLQFAPLSPALLEH
jgi:hypothetical protein